KTAHSDRKILDFRTHQRCDVPRSEMVVASSADFSLLSPHQSPMYSQAEAYATSRLLPPRQPPQKQVRVMARIVYVVQHGRAADFAGIVDYYIAKPEDSLPDRPRNCHVLNLGEWNVPGRPGNQAIVDFDL